MKLALNIEQAMHQISRDRLSQFGYDGWRALFEYMEALEDAIGEEIELDIIALCCDYIRFDGVEDYNEQYGTSYTSTDDIEEAVVFLDNGAFITYAH